MASSVYIEKVKKAFEESFPDGWIDAFSWKDKKMQKVIFQKGQQTIEAFKVNCFINLAKFVLSGDYLINDSDNLLDEIDRDVEEFSPNSCKVRTKLIELFNSVQYDLHVSTYLVKFFVNCTKQRFEQKHLDDLVTAVRYVVKENGRGELVKLLDCICSACQYEFNLTYGLDKIQAILLLREQLLDFNFSEEINNIRDAAVVKLELMLYKLTYYSKNKKITYNYNLQHVNLVPLKGETGKIIEFKKYFEDYLDVDSWGQDEINEYLVDFEAKEISLWKIVMSMRYYTKKSKNINQIDNLIQLNEKHRKESQELDRDNIVNRYSSKTAMNYLYNSRFSFLCTNDKTYTFDRLKDDLLKIEQVQNDTFVFNYHPYQKAFIFLAEFIEDELKNEKSSDEIRPHYDYLDYCFARFKETVDWCRVNQPYIMQLRFNFSTIVDKDRNLEIFYPSSFLRPLRFDHLKESISQFKNKLEFLQHQIASQDQRLELLAAHKKIENLEKDAQNRTTEMEKKSFEMMSYFSTIVVFLVGLITIFTGNGSNVSIFSKMEYVAVLGAILLLFISFGYLMKAQFNPKIKHWIFGVSTGALAIGIGNFFFNKSAEMPFEEDVKKSELILHVDNVAPMNDKQVKNKKDSINNQKILNKNKAHHK